MRWYSLHHRKLPWRENQDAYKIWLAEIIFQQTKIDQGLPYYRSFITAYPDVKALACATEQDVLRLWQGLGYYTRARNLHRCACLVVAEYQGIFPSTAKELEKLPGIGPYTAAAIASIAFGEAVPAMDGNAYRVLARIFGLHQDITLAASQKEFRKLALALIDKANPGIFSQALMEFGALWCTPKKPKCSACTFKKYCIAQKTNTQACLPVKSRHIRLKNRYFYYLVLQHKQKVYLKKRIAKDIWHGLYDFYLVETEAPCTFDMLPGSVLQQLKEHDYLVKKEYPSYCHQLTHQKIHATFIYINLKKPLKASEEVVDLVPVFYPQVEQLPKPVLIAKFWHHFVREAFPG